MVVHYRHARGPAHSEHGAVVATAAPGAAVLVAIVRTAAPAPAAADCQAAGGARPAVAAGSGVAGAATAENYSRGVVCGTGKRGMTQQGSFFTKL